MQQKRKIDYFLPPITAAVKVGFTVAVITKIYIIIKECFWNYGYNWSSKSKNLGQMHTFPACSYAQGFTVRTEPEPKVGELVHN